MCRACDQQERVCPSGHRQPKRHGDVFRPESTRCAVCGLPTRIEQKVVLL